VSVATRGELRSAALLRLLALSLAPDPERHDARVDLARALADEPDGDGVDVALLADALERTPAATWAEAHQRLFAGAVTVAPYESSYERDPFRQARVMSDVAGFYRAFGAEAHGPAAERPDHAGTELEFLGFLAERRVAALETGATDDAQRIGEIEHAFVVEHAGRWLPGFFRALAAADPEGPFGALGVVGEQALVAELVARDALDAASGPLTRAERTAVEGDDLECGAGLTAAERGPAAGGSA
jgi:TorA maturation chaperone TorD